MRRQHLGLMVLADDTVRRRSNFGPKRLRVESRCRTGKANQRGVLARLRKRPKALNLQGSGLRTGRRVHDALKLVGQHVLPLLAPSPITSAAARRDPGLVAVLVARQHLLEEFAASHGRSLRREPTHSGLKAAE
jgi:hypothetical protein